VSRSRAEEVHDPAAQAIIEAMPVISIDRQLDQFGVTRLW
jgi:hypothetical protein